MKKPALLSVKKIPHVFWSSNNPLNLRPGILTLVFLVLGLVLFGLGESVLIASGIGVSPWTVFAQGISNYTHWSVGLSTFVVSACLLLLWLPLKQKPGIGTVLNALIIALAIDLSLPYLPQPQTNLIQILQIIIGVIIIGLGSGLYLIANLGAGPRDGLMVGLQRITNYPISLVRTSLEISAVAIGWFMGGVVGLGTIIFALGIGPSVSMGLFLVNQFSRSEK